MIGIGPNGIRNTYALAVLAAVALGLLAFVAGATLNFLSHLP